MFMTDMLMSLTNKFILQDTALQTFMLSVFDRGGSPFQYFSKPKNALSEDSAQTAALFFHEFQH